MKPRSDHFTVETSGFEAPRSDRFGRFPQIDQAAVDFVAQPAPRKRSLRCWLG
jgi:hypothetical protein